MNYSYWGPKPIITVGEKTIWAKFVERPFGFNLYDSKECKQSVGWACNDAVSIEIAKSILERQV